MACLHRDPATADWAIRIVSEPTMGRAAQENVGDLVRWLHANPPQPLPQVAPGGARMLARTPTASAAMMAAHPSGRLVATPGMDVVTGQLADATLTGLPVVQAEAHVPMGEAVPMGQPVEAPPPYRAPYAGQ